MKKKLIGLILIFILASNYAAMAVSKSEIIVHQNDIDLKTSKGWIGSSLTDFFNSDPIKEIHLVSTLNGGNKDIVLSEIEDILNGEVKTSLINELPVASNNRIWTAFIITKKGKAFLLRKTWYQCFILSHGADQGVYQSNKSKYDSDKE
jgi:hypothetical protein